MDRRRLTQRNPAHTATPVSMRRTRAATSAGRARAGGGLPPVTQESVRALLDGAFAASPAPPPDLVNSILSLIPTASAAATADEMAERFVGMLDTLVGLKFTNHATSPALHARLLKSVDAPRAWAEWRGQGELLLRDGASALLLSATAAESEEMWAGLHVGALAQEVVESVRLAVAALMPAPQARGTAGAASIEPARASVAASPLAVPAAAPFEPARASVCHAATATSPWAAALPEPARAATPPAVALPANVAARPGVGSLPTRGGGAARAAVATPKRRRPSAQTPAAAAAASAPLPTAWQATDSDSDSDAESNSDPGKGPKPEPEPNPPAARQRTGGGHMFKSIAAARGGAAAVQQQPFRALLPVARVGAVRPTTIPTVPVSRFASTRKKFQAKLREQQTLNNAVRMCMTERRRALSDVLQRETIVTQGTRFAHTIAQMSNTSVNLWWRAPSHVDRSQDVRDLVSKRDELMRENKSAETEAVDRYVKGMSLVQEAASRQLNAEPLEDELQDFGTSYGEGMYKEYANEEASAQGGGDDGMLDANQFIDLLQREVLLPRGYTLWEVKLDGVPADEYPRLETEDLQMLTTEFRDRYEKFKDLKQQPKEYKLLRQFLNDKLQEAKREQEKQEKKLDYAADYKYNPDSGASATDFEVQDLDSKVRKYQSMAAFARRRVRFCSRVLKSLEAYEENAQRLIPRARGSIEQWRDFLHSLNADIDSYKEYASAVRQAADLAADTLHLKAVTHSVTEELVALISRKNGSNSTRITARLHAELGRTNAFLEETYGKKELWRSWQQLQSLTMQVGPSMKFETAVKTKVKFVDFVGLQTDAAPGSTRASPVRKRPGLDRQRRLSVTSTEQSLETAELFKGFKETLDEHGLNDAVQTAKHTAMLKPGAIPGFFSLLQNLKETRLEQGDESWYDLMGDLVDIWVKEEHENASKQGSIDDPTLKNEFTNYAMIVATFIKETTITAPTGATSWINRDAYKELPRMVQDRLRLGTELTGSSPLALLKMRKTYRY